MSVRFEIAHANVLEYQADVLALKYAQELFGVDAIVVGLLTRKTTLLVNTTLPKAGESLRLPSQAVIAAREILLVGVERRFDYETIRRFGYSVLSILGRTRSKVEHIAMTMQGTGWSGSSTWTAASWRAPIQPLPSETGSDR